ncbi:MAG: hypothetical protein PWP28_2074 [Oceanotoga sp.]|uniref:Uncharacterized protein n=1 Tax=Oceanotoga teriensis TaxID=515440 RepID=A0AA45C7S3_9BACT|nr:MULTISPECIES: DUF4974 domain-containing protein [Oceanotoga]MDN5343199.1 hypothetical protein [Oceanotoga sp.]PWJ95466.1 hypothetical protein C7380_10596 [Oceanotoga teriensis]
MKKLIILFFVMISFFAYSHDLIYNNIDIKTLFIDLENIYGVEFIFLDDIDENFTFKSSTDSVETLMDILFYSKGIKYEKYSDSVYVIMKIKGHYPIKNEFVQKIELINTDTNLLNPFLEMYRNNIYFINNSKYIIFKNNGDLEDKIKDFFNNISYDNSRYFIIKNKYLLNFKDIDEKYIKDINFFYKYNYKFSELYDIEYDFFDNIDEYDEKNIKKENFYINTDKDFFYVYGIFERKKFINKNNLNYDFDYGISFERNINFYGDVYNDKNYINFIWGIDKNFFVSGGAFVDRNFGYGLFYKWDEMSLFGVEGRFLFDFDHFNSNFIIKAGSDVNDFKFKDIIFGFEGYLLYTLNDIFSVGTRFENDFQKEFFIDPIFMMKDKKIKIEMTFNKFSKIIIKFELI